MKTVVSLAALLARHHVIQHPAPPANPILIFTDPGSNDF